MVEEEPAALTTAVAEPLELLRANAAWLFAPELGACIVGSYALALACRAADVEGPSPADLDLAWVPDPEQGTALLQQRGIQLATTVGNVARGTLAMRIAGLRIEVTTLRGGRPGDPVPARIAADLGERDMTIGALAVELANGRIHDPHRGLDDWRHRRIVATGDPAARVREHPIRWLRYYRKAHEFGFALDAAIRTLDLDATVLDSLPAEAVALELRAILRACPSPGRCLLELYEDGLLAHLSPELNRQFDGRPAGPQRWHPEVSQALHLILCLEWAVRRTRDLADRDQLAVCLAVLCHDLGKGYTPEAELPGHRGHEHGGLPYVAAFLDRWPGLADARSRMLANDVCALHLVVRRFDELRSGTLARLYDESFRAKDYPVELFAMALAADSAGRLGHGESGELVYRVTCDRLAWLRAVAGSVDAAALRAQFPDDLDAFRAALHEARARAIAARRAEITAPAGEDLQ